MFDSPANSSSLLGFSAHEPTRGASLYELMRRYSDAQRESQVDNQRELMAADVAFWIPRRGYRMLTRTAPQVEAGWRSRWSLGSLRDRRNAP